MSKVFLKKETIQDNENLPIITDKNILEELTEQLVIKHSNNFLDIKKEPLSSGVNNIIRTTDNPSCEYKETYVLFTYIIFDEYFKSEELDLIGRFIFLDIADDMTEAIKKSETIISNFNSYFPIHILKTNKQQFLDKNVMKNYIPPYIDEISKNFYEKNKEEEKNIKILLDKKREEDKKLFKSFVESKVENSDDLESFERFVLFKNTANTLFMNIENSKKVLKNLTKKFEILCRLCKKISSINTSYDMNWKLINIEESKNNKISYIISDSFIDEYDKLEFNDEKESISDLYDHYISKN